MAGFSSFENTHIQSKWAANKALSNKTENIKTLFGLGLKQINTLTTNKYVRNISQIKNTLKLKNFAFILFNNVEAGAS